MDIRLGVVSAMFTSLRHKSVLSPAQEAEIKVPSSALQEEAEPQLEATTEKALAAPQDSRQEVSDGAKSSKRKRHKKR